MNNIFKFLGIVAITAIIGFSMLSCDMGGDKPGPVETKPLFSISGEFADGSVDAYFKAATDTTVARSARSARSVGGEHELSGELEDGDILLRLKGTYDASTGNYTLSAAASFARYTISGDQDGAIATLAVRDSGGDWTSFIVDVKNIQTDEVAVQDDADFDDDLSDEAGIPSWAWGNNMYFEWGGLGDADNNSGNWGEGNATITQWYISTDSSGSYNGWLSNSSQSYTVIEYESVSNDEYDIIFTYPVYEATDVQGRAAAAKFFEDIGLTAVLWDKSGSPWDPEYVDSITNWDVVFYDFNGGIDIKNGWDVNRELYQKWWDNDYLNKYLVRNYSSAQLDSTTWYTKIKFSHSGNDITLRFYDGDGEASGKPAGNSTDLSKVQALTDTSLYSASGRYDYEERYNTSFNPTRTQKPLNLYAKNGAGWATTIGNVAGWYEGSGSIYGLDDSYVIQTVSMDYTPWNKLVIEFSTVPTGDLVIKLMSGDRDNSGVFSEYTGGIGSWENLTTSGKEVIFDYAAAYNAGSSVWQNTDLGTSFDILNVYQITIEAGTYDGEGNLTDKKDISSQIEKIWLEPGYTTITGGAVVVTGVTVSPANVEVIKGETQSFSAKVNGTGNPAQTVTWSVTGGGAGTSINSSGLLTVAAGETATSLTVKAVSTVNSSKSGEATVKVSDVPEIDTSVTSWKGLNVSPGNTAYEHTTYQSKSDVLQVIPGSGYSVLNYDLSAYVGKTVTIDVSMDVWLVDTSSKVVWQLAVDGKDGDDYPLIAGSWSELTAGEWQSVSPTMTTVTVRASSPLFLSADQLGSTELYIANFSIEVTEVEAAVLNPMFTYGQTDDDPPETNYQVAVWTLSDDDVTIAQTEGAMLVLQLKKAPDADVALVWQNTGAGIYWQSTDILKNGEPTSESVIWDATEKTLTIILNSDTIKDYDDGDDIFIEQSALNFCIGYWKDGGDVADLLESASVQQE